MRAHHSDFEWTTVDGCHFGAIADSYRTFLGHQLLVSINGPKGSSAPDSESLNLLSSILADFDTILNRAESALHDYAGATDKGYEEHIVEPTIFITAGSLKWTLGMERDDWPDFGWHIEFSGTDFVEVWAGT
jgi:hypothetical protein